MKPLITVLIFLLILLCDEHWEVCPEDVFGGEDFECPISEPETPDFDKR